MKLIVTMALLLSVFLLYVQGQESASRPEDPEADVWAPLSFDELVTLSAASAPPEKLSLRLNQLLTTPIIQNLAATDTLPPHRPVLKNLGPVVREGLWNIERGLNFELIRSALTDTVEFERVTGNLNHVRDPRRELVKSQLMSLQNVDILVLNEVDRGMKRTEYRDVARELAGALHMNYAYGVEFVEVDPVFELGTEKVHLPGAQEDHRWQSDLQVDHQRYQGLHGTAILSRYAISLAAEYDAELTLLHVTERVSDLAKAEAMIAECTQELEKLLSRTERKTFNVTFSVKFGKPYEEIVRYATEMQASLIIMTARGGDAVDRAVFGSTTYRVIQLGPCPVLAVHT